MLAGELGSASPMKLLAELVDESGNASPISVTESTASSFAASSGSAGAAISGVIPETEPGFYTLRVKPADADSSVESSEITFQVVVESRELDRPMADPVYLRQLAELTADHGGASFAADEMNELLQIIAARRTKAEIPVVEKHRLGDGPVSGWILFTLFAGALSIEWLLRRQWGMA